MFLFFLVVFIIALAFSILNIHPVEVNFYYGKVTLPFALVLTLELLAGVFIGITGCFMQYLRLKTQHAKLKKQLNQAEKQLAALRLQANSS